MSGRKTHLFRNFRRNKQVIFQGPKKLPTAISTVRQKRWIQAEAYVFSGGQQVASVHAVRWTCVVFYAVVFLLGFLLFCDQCRVYHEIEGIRGGMPLRGK